MVTKTGDTDMDIVVYGLAGCLTVSAAYVAFRLLSERAYEEIVVKRVDKDVMVTTGGIRPHRRREVRLALVRQIRSNYRNIVLKERVLDEEIIPPSVVQTMEQDGTFGGWRSRYARILDAHHALEKCSRDIALQHEGRRGGASRYDASGYDYFYPGDRHGSTVMDVDFVEVT